MREWFACPVHFHISVRSQKHPAMIAREPISIARQTPYLNRSFAGLTTIRTSETSNEITTKPANAYNGHLSLVIRSILTRSPAPCTWYSNAKIADVQINKVMFNIQRINSLRFSAAGFTDFIHQPLNFSSRWRWESRLILEKLFAALRTETSIWLRQG